MLTDNFELIIFNLENKEHLIFLDKMINSPNSELISSDLKRFVERNIKKNKEDNITNCYIVKYNNELIGLSFLNYHPKEKRNNEILLEEIEIGFGLLPEFRGKGLGSLFEKEFSEYLLNLYPQFNEIVARVEEDNISSINALKKAGFERYKDDEYHYKKNRYEH